MEPNPNTRQHEPNAPGAAQHQHAVRLPSIPLSLHTVDTILFAVERGDPAHALTNILSTAALYRAIRNERGAAPHLKVAGEIQLNNALTGSTECEFLSNLLQGENAIFLSAASFYRKQLAQLIGTYALSGGALHGTLHSVDDSIPLGKREEPLLPIRGFVQSLVRDSSDPHLHALLALAEKVEKATTDPLITDCRAALTTLHRENLPFRIRQDKNLQKLFPTIHQMIEELATTIDLPTCAKPAHERHTEALQIARAVWSDATEIAPGIFQLFEIPFAEREMLVEGLLKDIYTNDPKATFVLERGIDRPATALSYEEALTFERRLGAGEEPEELLAEISKRLVARKDSSSLTDIEIAEMRDRDPRDTLERILEKSQYHPDPSGLQYTIRKSPADLRMVKALKDEQIPIITHNALWLCNLKTGEAEPVILSFQAKHLERFIDAFARQ